MSSGSYCGAAPPSNTGLTVVYKNGGGADTEAQGPCSMAPLAASSLCSSCAAFTVIPVTAGSWQFGCNLQTSSATPPPGSGCQSSLVCF